MNDINELVLLNRQQAYLVTHVLAVFERLLRQGRLAPEQLAYLTADTAGVALDADVEMAEIVAEAAAPLRSQL